MGWLCVSVALTACNFLDTEPSDFLHTDNYYRNLDDLENALAGVYRVIGEGDSYGELLVYESLPDDLIYRNGSIVTNVVCGPYFTAASTEVQQMWDLLYVGIDRANVLLENIDRAEVKNEADREAIRAEAYFMRGYLHFVLSDMWGGVPIKHSSSTSPTDVNRKRATLAKTLDAALQDMEERGVKTGNLYSADKFSHNTRVSQTVAEAIVARVYMQMAGYPLNGGDAMWERALYYANKVKDSGLHQLNPDYNNIFIRHGQDLFDTDFRESMWEANFVGNSSTHPGKGGESQISAGLGIRFAAEGVLDGSLAELGVSIKLGYCYGNYKGRLNLWDMYTKEDRGGDYNDIRRNRTLSPYTLGGTTTVTKSYLDTWPEVDGQIKNKVGDRYVAKWRREEELLQPQLKGKGATNFPIIRYSDVVLIIAEAENELYGVTQTAIDRLNDVRMRAHAFPYAAGDFADKDDFRQMIRNERARELAVEGRRKFDLIRWGIYIETMKSLVQEGNDSRVSNKEYALAWPTKIGDRHLLMPIPQNEMNTNNLMVQNPGWN